MYQKVMREYLEGLATLADVERAVSADPRPLKARAQAEEDLADEWDIKRVLANVPPPPTGLAAVKKALKDAPIPKTHPESEETLMDISTLGRLIFPAMLEPAGGFEAAISRVKSRLAAAPAPKQISKAASEFDIKPCFDEQPVERKLVLVDSKRKRGVTKKIIGIPRRETGRDVLAAGKDLPEE